MVADQAVLSSWRSVVGALEDGTTWSALRRAGEQQYTLGAALLPALTWRPGTEATGGRTVEGPGMPALAARLAGRSGR